jgi:hypothetical protein
MLLLTSQNLRFLLADGNAHESGVVSLNVDGKERCRRGQAGPVGDKIGSPIRPLTKLSPG